MVSRTHAPGTSDEVPPLSRIPYAHRIEGRYVWRRRVHFRNLISKPLPLALRTADPSTARRRSAILSARFAILKQTIDEMLDDHRTFLTGAEIEALFRAELERELARNLADAYSNESHSSSVGEAARPLAEAYRIARRPDRPRRLSERDVAELVQRGVDAGDRAQVAEYLAEFCHGAGVSDDEVRARLEAIGAPVTDALMEMARSHVLRARADAWRRTERIFDDAVTDAPNPLQALLELEVVAQTAAPTPPPAPVPAPPAASSPLASPPVVDRPFVVDEPRRFGELIDEIVAELRREKIWKGDCAQQRRIMATFAWITGDKPCGAYTHLDVAAFKRGLMRLPRNFAFGSVTDGAMSRPFAEVVAALPPVPSELERHAKTVNRDLSTMSRVSRHLAQTVWRSRTSNSLVLDFAGMTLPLRKRSGEDPRPPWTKEHLGLLFRSPLYLGGGDALERLRGVGRAGKVWHDAAYWVPLLCYYHHSCREETCGLRVDEVVDEHEVPHFVIKDNDVRGRDGELAGEKREARRRKLPLHAELLRLGFLDYVRAIRAEGHVALFPELYVAEAKRGGAWFYARAWEHMVAWIGERMPLPRNPAGKGPDMHSIRALGSSFYEVEGVNENMRADVMGHARTGVNGIHYSKRLATEGLTTVLTERRDFMARYVTVITADLEPRAVRLLPLDRRSRVGSSIARRTRSDAGSGQRPHPRGRRSPPPQ